MEISSRPGSSRNADPRLDCEWITVTKALEASTDTSTLLQPRNRGLTGYRSFIEGSLGHLRELHYAWQDVVSGLSTFERVAAGNPGFG